MIGWIIVGIVIALIIAVTVVVSQEWSWNRRQSRSTLETGSAIPPSKKPRTHMKEYNQPLDTKENAEFLKDVGF